MARRPPQSEPSEQHDLEEQLFEPRMPDDGSPGRIIATMVGIVGILLLGSLFWSAVGALFGALGAASEAVPFVRPAPTLVLGPPPTALPPTAAPAARPVEPTRPAPTAEPTQLAEATPTAQPQATPTAEAEGRAPWVLLPLPAPGSKVSPGQVTLEARGRGDAAISKISLEFDGAAVPTTVEQRSDSIWRGFAAIRLSAGQHSARATVVDERGRSGSFRWTFEAAP
ncbi:MAG TPA: hypothetical protein VGL99_22615 [Chloroflexota bacterium]